MVYWGGGGGTSRLGFDWSSFQANSANTVPAASEAKVPRMPIPSEMSTMPYCAS